MNLREYLIETKQTQKQFAKEVNLSRPTINLYINQLVIPKPIHCQRIHIATSGKVTEKDFIHDNIQKIKSLMSKYDIKVKELAFTIGKSEVATHNKLNFISSITSWEIYLVTQYITNAIKNKKNQRIRKF
ncbi:MAG: helix-turn-helix transcriptional regulator [Alphaproteobacteria bacterium]|jgi:transcriptional regulator with XRE-family HTH domain|nr:helix-turn-helix transcriptional regulator [Alphaproteobacteria bacterium]